MGINKQRPLPTDLFNDEDLLAMDDDLFRTAIGLRMLADDFGRQTCTDWMVRPEIYRGRPMVTEEVLVDHMLRLDALGVIGIYPSGDRTYYAIRVWPAVSHPTPSKHPAPPPDLFQRFAGSHPEGRSAWEREREESGERAEESPSWNVAGLPPSSFCKVHQPRGSGGIPCIYCQDARLAAKEWEQNRRRVAFEDLTDN